MTCRLRGVQPGRHAHRHRVRGQDRAGVGRQTGSAARHARADTRNGVDSAAFSPDGARVVTASGDKTARVWDAATGEPLATLAGHDDDVVSRAAFSPDGARVVTASQDKTARVWDAATGAPLATLEGHDGTVSQRGVQPGRRARRHRLLGQDRAAVGRQDRRAAGHARGARGSRVERGVQPGRQPRRHRLLRTRPRGCGTRKTGVPLATLAGHDG